jgi:hypothetical protein
MAKTLKLKRKTNWLAALVFASLAVNSGLAGMFLAQHSKPEVKTVRAAKTSGKSTHVQIAKTEDEALGKGGLTVSVILKNGSTPAFIESQSEAAEESEVADAGVANPDNDVSASEEPVIEPAGVTLPEGIPAMLRKGKLAGAVDIGNFKSVAMAGQADECLPLAQSLLQAAEGPEDALDVMIANSQITIAKICASNGTVVLTCRGGNITISPRRTKPGDSCTRA